MDSLGKGKHFHYAAQYPKKSTATTDASESHIAGVSCTLDNAVIINMQHSTAQVRKVLSVEEPSIVHLQHR